MQDDNAEPADNRWAFLAAAMLARGATGFQFQSLASLAPLLVAGLGIGLTEIGTLAGVYMAPGVVMSLLAGAMLGRLGVRRTLLLSYAAMAIAGVLASVAGGFETLAAARILGGAGAVGLAVAALKGMFDRFEVRELPFANGLATAAQPFGMGCAMLVFAVWGAALGWRTGFAITGGVAAVGFLTTAIFVRRRRAGAAAAAYRLGRSEWTRLVLAGLAVAPFTGFFYALLSFLPTLLHDTGWSPENAGLALGVIGWAPVIGAPLGGWIAGRTGRPLTLTFVCLIFWASSVLSIPVFGFTIPALIVMIVAGPPPVGVIMSLAARATGPEGRAAASGVFMAFMFGGAAAIPAIAAFVGEALGGDGLPGLYAAITFCGIGAYSTLIPYFLFERAATRAGA